MRIADINFFFFFPKMAKTALSVLVVLLFFAFASSMSLKINQKLVAVTGSTGRLGRRAVVDLAEQGIPTRCLVRRDIPEDTIPDLEGTSSQVAAYLKSLPGVELFKGDVINPEDMEKLCEGCTSILSLHGPSATGVPVWKSICNLVSPTDPNCARMICYVGVQNIIAAVKKPGSICRRIVRITGKGEDPYGKFSILINMFGTMAKAWNYEGEELLRQSGLDYTIIRPGIMVKEVPSDSLCGLQDNGGDLPVTQVAYNQIADLSVQCLGYKNAAKTTLTAMNLKSEEGGEATYDKLLEKVSPDTRIFPASLMEEHKKGARLGAAVLVVFLAVFTKLLAAIFGKLLGIFRGMF